MSPITRPHLLSLPQELLENITCLFPSSPSLRSLREQPTNGMIESNDRPLKSLSQTCRSMRSSIFNKLFEYTKLKLTILGDENYWNPPQINDSEVNNFIKFVRSWTLIPHIRSVVIYTTESTCNLSESGLMHLQSLGNPGSAMITILDAIDPELFTIIASPVVLSSLTSTFVNSEDAWAFAIPLQVLHLRQLPRLTRAMRPTLSTPSNLIRSRPWTHCVINEGSSIPVYQTYEYYLKMQPSILPSITHAPASLHGNAYTTLESLEHITICPTSNHVTVINKFICSLPNLRCLTLSLWPPAHGDFLSDAMKRHKLDLSDVWVGCREMNKQLNWIMERSPHDLPIRELNLLNDIDCTVGSYHGHRPLGWRRTSLTSYVRDSPQDLRFLEQ